MFGLFLEAFLEQLAGVLAIFIGDIAGGAAVKIQALCAFFHFLQVAGGHGVAAHGQAYGLAAQVRQGREQLLVDADGERAEITEYRVTGLQVFQYAAGIDGFFLRGSGVLGHGQDANEGK